MTQLYIEKRKLIESGYQQLPDLIRNTRNLRPAQKLVLAAILDFIRKDWSACYPSQRTLAGLTGLNQSYVSRVLQQLQAKGILGIERRSLQRSSVLSIKFNTLNRLIAPVLTGEPSSTHGDAYSTHGDASGVQCDACGTQILKSDIPRSNIPKEEHLHLQGALRLISGGAEEKAHGEGETEVGRVEGIRLGNPYPEPPAPTPTPKEEDQEEPQEEVMGDEKNPLSKEYQARKTERQLARESARKPISQLAKKQDPAIRRICQVFFSACKDTGVVPFESPSDFENKVVGSRITAEIKAMTDALGSGAAEDYVRESVLNWDAFRNRHQDDGFEIKGTPCLHNLTAHWRYNEWKTKTGNSSLSEKSQETNESQSPKTPSAIDTWEEYTCQKPKPSAKSSK